MKNLDCKKKGSKGKAITTKVRTMIFLGKGVVVTKNSIKRTSGGWVESIS